ncbi:unnamed protein product [Nezara viridula]|uniref:EML-like first beta-propeller domain-containing protein n=1 Tax=Nezara viridula TaxID=85310 RepID=A0A9P0E3V1_NEZVI|nr:unnamed protein product [Nezara viridula]
MYLRGRPVVLYAPSNLVDTYDVVKVAAPPQQKLELEWVLALHPERMQLASGQVGGHDGRAHIRVWDSITLATLAVIGLGEIHASVACLAFSKTDGGKYLCGIDDSNEHNISIWDWESGDEGVKVAEVKVK